MSFSKVLMIIKKPVFQQTQNDYPSDKEIKNKEDY